MESLREIHGEHQGNGRLRYVAGGHWMCVGRFSDFLFFFGGRPKMGTIDVPMKFPMRLAPFSQAFWKLNGKKLGIPRFVAPMT